MSETTTIIKSEGWVKLKFTILFAILSATVWLCNQVNDFKETVKEDHLIALQLIASNHVECVDNFQKSWHVQDEAEAYHQAITYGKPASPSEVLRVSRHGAELLNNPN